MQVVQRVQDTRTGDITARFIIILRQSLRYEWNSTIVFAKAGSGVAGDPPPGRGLRALFEDEKMGLLDAWFTGVDQGKSRLS